MLAPDDRIAILMHGGLKGAKGKTRRFSAALQPKPNRLCN